MTIRAARGGTAVRWTYGVFLTLCVVLAVFVHHGTPAMDPAAMPGPAHAEQAMPVGTAPSVPGTAAHSADDCTCTGAMPGMQHCSAAGVDSVQLAAPDRAAFDLPAKLRQAAAGRVPGAAATGRAPPDLSVLSQLRI
ncbi:DUF6153 family protein [Streptomyces sp. NPDC058457]|uniref:DUF6153 family protein n=1 Tax=Streptomyces sp. NPDC058457 TaxID=3346507 RepID=UPI003665C623